MTVNVGSGRCNDTHQWSRRAWRNADRPSITSRMETVSMAKRPNTGTRNTTPTRVVILRPRRITMDHNTSDNSEATQTVTQFAKESVQSRRRRRGLYSRAWARLSAQRRRYDAVLEMHPRQYSMVWMAWYRSTSAKSNCKSVKKKKKKKVRCHIIFILRRWSLKEQSTQKWKFSHLGRCFEVRSCPLKMYWTCEGRIVVDLWPLWGELLCWSLHQAPPLHPPRRTVLWNCRPHLHASPSHNPEVTRQQWCYWQMKPKLITLRVWPCFESGDETYSAPAQAFASSVQPVQVERFS